MWVQKIHGLITGQALIKIGKPIEMDDIPKDLKRNEKVDFLTKKSKDAQLNYKRT